MEKVAEVLANAPESDSEDEEELEQMELEDQRIGAHLQCHGTQYSSEVGFEYPGTYDLEAEEQSCQGSVQTWQSPGYCTQTPASEGEQVMEEAMTVKEGKVSEFQSHGLNTRQWRGKGDEAWELALAGVSSDVRSIVAVFRIIEYFLGCIDRAIWTHRTPKRVFQKLLATSIAMIYDPIWFHSSEDPGRCLSVSKRLSKLWARVLEYSNDELGVCPQTRNAVISFLGQSDAQFVTSVALFHMNSEFRLKFATKTNQQGKGRAQTEDKEGVSVQLGCIHSAHIDPGNPLSRGFPGISCRLAPVFVTQEQHLQSLWQQARREGKMVLELSRGSLVVMDRWAISQAQQLLSAILEFGKANPQFDDLFASVKDGEQYKLLFAIRKICHHLRTQTVGDETRRPQDPATAFLLAFSVSYAIAQPEASRAWQRQPEDSSISEVLPWITQHLGVAWGALLHHSNSELQIDERTREAVTVLLSDLEDSLSTSPMAWSQPHFTILPLRTDIVM
mmetsp:Transcript_41697/g.65078  ORF Transcript_41697/g.65078 Transcript_41697/m.65078 type:complete len:503 (-) Transcript_41697:677-2185(-)|eukprot:CAMPEP_0184299064 /NCGR_PEP_ID=MMETSP1049-20130417/9744_1 /TAXON_ID=77928 /ORGANISM="Proteomonas sulcata, Strain CCMP704" /LENGTH=502 /DNA_ID=CAMNT_0026609391 /DNA_START=288 /DNA_END=1796 /DNA_ORIENTATION=-